MGMLSATSWGLIFSIGRNLKILSLPLTTVPHVNRADYQLIDISEDGFFISGGLANFRDVELHRALLFWEVSLLTVSGCTKDDLRLPSDENLFGQIKDGLAEGKDLVVSIMSAMGKEQICALKDIGPTN